MSIDGPLTAPLGPLPGGAPSCGDEAAWMRRRHHMPAETAPRAQGLRPPPARNALVVPVQNRAKAAQALHQPLQAAKQMDTVHHEIGPEHKPLLRRNSTRFHQCVPFGQKMTRNIH